MLRCASERAFSSALTGIPLAANVASAQTPYSLLRFDEDALGLSSPLAHAKAAKGLAAAVLTAKQG